MASSAHRVQPDAVAFAVRHWAMNPWLPGSAILGINTFAPAASRV